MTHTEAAADLEEAELQQHLGRDREAWPTMSAARPKLAEWARIVQLLAVGAYAPDTEAVVQDELAADAERERARQLETRSAARRRKPKPPAGLAERGRAGRRQSAARLRPGGRARRQRAARPRA
ncbi:hypothetical protein OG585_55185 (plasmid) [Streptomyces sp. NBC_01340]|nr:MULTISPECIES: hypothetical protein [unclassified Streptomyces]MCX4500707.1 hypothetical protein [Streptomyces sp. NBC_01728]WSI35918.1 hypothetical protein OG585_00300 [Streptomyces sp. NBC_01340]WSI43894.1 hypothetical protein OG585_46620 [Streptomyces sp. NBC_01340]WSI45829.1 hypothetical protein OG585_55185 [Streptomyces sp. NBC_01340]